jgi:acyl-coenzyme A thioesterase PaaI-like protein
MGPMAQKSLQERYAPKSICFGCGPSNAQGLKIRSLAPESVTPATLDQAVVTCEWTPKPFHEAFPGMLNGGIIGSLLDCHSNWTAAWALMVFNGATEPPCTVTAEYAIKLKRPTPSAGPVYLEARVAEISEDRARIEATLSADVGGERKVCATCTGLFVAVKPGHPAYHRWG